MAARAVCYVNSNDKEAAKQDYITIITQYCSDAKSAKVAIESLTNFQMEDQEYNKYAALYSSCTGDTESLETLAFTKAQNAYQREDYSVAVARFKTYKQQYKTTIKAIKSDYYIAKSFDRLNLIDSASIYYDYYLSSGDKEFYNDIIIGYVQSSLDRKQYEKAVKYGEEALKLTQDQRKIYMYNDLMIAYYEVENYSKADTLAKTLESVSDQGTWTAYNAALYQAKVNYQQGNTIEAKAAFEEIGKNTSGKAGADAYYSLGKILYDSAQYQASIDQLLSLKRIFPSHQYEVGVGSILIADNYIQLGSLGNAEAVLQSIIDNYPDGDEIKQKALKKIQEVEKIREEINTPEQENDTIQVDPKDIQQEDGGIDEIIGE